MIRNEYFLDWCCIAQDYHNVLFKDDHVILEQWMNYRAERLADWMLTYRTFSWQLLLDFRQSVDICFDLQINIWPKELKDCDEVGFVVATSYKCVLWLNPSYQV